MFYAKGDGLYSITVKEGSVPELILARQKDKGERWLMHPQFFPDANSLLFTVEYTNRVVSLEALDLTTKARRTIDLKGSYNPAFYPATGRLIYGRDDMMWARRFDPRTLEFTGPEISLLKDLGRDWGASCHQFTFARNGTLVYARGHQSQPRHQLVWIKAQGLPEVLPLDPAKYSFPRLAADGRSLILRGASSKQFHVSLPNGVPVELGVPDENTFVFAYDGKHAYAGHRGGTNQIVVRMRADGTGQPETIYQTDDRPTFAGDISGDGKYLALVVGENDPDRYDIWVKELGSQDKAQPLATTKANEVSPKFSPDGRWLAYAANMTARYEIYVKNIRDGGLPIQVSKGGGSNPVWSRDGRRIYYRNANGVMVAKAKTGDPLEFDAPTLFATGRFGYHGVNQPANYDVFTGEDGDRLLMVKSVDPEPEPQYATQVTVMVNFDEYIRKQEAAQSKKAANP